MSNFFVFLVFIAICYIVLDWMCRVTRDISNYWKNRGEE